MKELTKVKWRHWNEECPFCGNDIEVLTELEDGTAYDGDEVRCVECGEKGSIVVNEPYATAIFNNW